MIERYTIKFGPAVSQKELEKALHEGKESTELTSLHKLKARIEVICDYKDLHTIDEFIKHCCDIDKHSH
jgi:hypothetical protein